ncbi:hypothetical protein CROQUDRAFT_659449 [Cronartium quercuum f. sp. fusiforme G11]|uniref:S-adenosyl-L-methionine-dependent methyltransferase n=1 Tax=Cronartium quercuum f. sp. fusiforme G11 TaxID=708437 RepID=A0A9P6NIZ3_9BASI|nr:hypothetical protein CROQUDRAFT_659449 [Cronartium quercuum f. sp. fusiforme G11]
MSILGYNHHSERLASLVTEACILLDSTVPRALICDEDVDEKAKALKAKLKVILDDAQAVASGLEGYLERCSSVPDRSAQSTKVLEEMLAATDSTDWAGLHANGQTRYRLMSEMSSNVYEAGLVGFICSLVCPKRVLEVGMFTGTLTTIFAGSPSVEKVVSLEYEAYLETWARPFWRRAGSEVNEKIEVRVGMAKESLEQMAQNGEEAFDIILIDADKSSYPTYIKQIISHKLLSKKGLLMIDNAIYKATAYAPFPVPLTVPSEVDSELVEAINANGKVLNGMNEMLRDHPELEVVLLPTRDGLSLVRWKGN